MIKRENDFTLKEVIERLLKVYSWDMQLDEAKLKDSWEKVVGGIIGKHTVNLYIKNRILYVSLDSSVIRSELLLSRSKIVKMLNDEVGKKVIDDMVLR
jgi:predicted nucleic acid-binding Zn ribbon protein